MARIIPDIETRVFPDGNTVGVTRDIPTAAFFIERWDGRRLFMGYMPLDSAPFVEGCPVWESDGKDWYKSYGGISDASEFQCILNAFMNFGNIQ